MHSVRKALFAAGNEVNSNKLFFAEESDFSFYLNNMWNEDIIYGTKGMAEMKNVISEVNYDKRT